MLVISVFNKVGPMSSGASSNVTMTVVYCWLARITTLEVWSKLDEWQLTYCWHWVCGGWKVVLVVVVVSGVHSKCQSPCLGSLIEDLKRIICTQITKIWNHFALFGDVWEVNVTSTFLKIFPYPLHTWLEFLWHRIPRQVSTRTKFYTTVNRQN